MRPFLRPLLTLVALLLPALAHAQYGSAQASAQAGLVPNSAGIEAQVNSSPLRVVVPSNTVIEREITIPAEYEDVVVRRQVAPERTVIQRDVIQRDVVHYAPARAISYAPVRSFAVGNSCNVGAQALANVGYSTGVANNVVVARGLRQRAPRQQAQRTVSRSKAVTRTGRPGILNGLLGR